MGKIRDAMVQDLQLRNLRPATCESYLRSAAKFVRHFNKAPTDMGTAEVRVFLTSLKDRGYSASSMRVYRAGLRFLFAVTLRRPDVVNDVPCPKKRSKKPRVLSALEVERLLEASPSVLHRAIFLVTYSAGLRISETCALQVRDIQSQRGVIYVRDGKGGKDRYAKLSPRTLLELRAYWKETRPKGPWLFPGQTGDRPITTAAFRKGLIATCKRLSMDRVTPHQLRHSYATHMLALGADVRVLQLLLGHAQASSTEHYLTVTMEILRHTESPADVLGTERAKVLG